MAKVASEAGTAFDPAVVRALQARYQELEARAKAASTEVPASLSKDIKIERGSAPAAGFETEAAESSLNMHPVARARATDAIGKSSMEMPSAGACKLSREEALAVASMRLKQMVPCDAMAFYGCDGRVLRSNLVTGDDRGLLTSLRIPMGEGLVGWVAETGTPIMNGNPQVEPGFVREGIETSRLSSALALPLEEGGRIAGVLALYRARVDAFSTDDLETLRPLCPAVASILVESENTDTQNLAVSLLKESGARHVSSQIPEPQLLREL